MVTDRLHGNVVTSTSGFVDGVMFARNRPGKGDISRVKLEVSHQGAAQMETDSRTGLISMISGLLPPTQIPHTLNTCRIQHQLAINRRNDFNG